MLSRKWMTYADHGIQQNPIVKSFGFPAGGRGPGLIWPEYETYYATCSSTLARIQTRPAAEAGISCLFLSNSRHLRRALICHALSLFNLLRKTS